MNIRILLIATLCLLSVLLVQCRSNPVQPLPKFTPAQMDEGYYLMNMLAANLRTVDAKCTFIEASKNETCYVHVDKVINLGFITQHIKFDAMVSARVDLQRDLVTVLSTLNGKSIYTKEISIEKLHEPICTPILDGLLNLCVQFSDINFNVHNNCFVANVQALVKFFTMEIKLFSDEFGWNQEKCRARTMFGY